MQEPPSTGDGMNAASEALPAVSAVPLIVAGASAGGLPALKRFLEALPDNLGAALLLVQHLSPDYRSVMAHLLRRDTTMDIQDMAEGVPLEANKVYLLPAGFQAELEGDTLRLLGKGQYRKPFYPIDVLLQSVANQTERARHALALIFSGTGSDGTNGSKALHRAGGMVGAQQPSTSRFNGMPLSVIHTNICGVVGAPEELAQAAADWARHGFRAQRALASPRSRPVPEPQVAASAALNAGRSVAGPFVGPYGRLFELIHTVYDLDLSLYKPGTIERRIESRMAQSRVGSIDEYLQKVTDNPGELQRLFSDLLIGVTSFFRDQEVFDLLDHTLLPDMVKKASGSLKVWVCGCSTGQEAYSLAMLLDKHVIAHNPGLDLRLFATDINLEAIRIASYGTYPREELATFIERYGLQDQVVLDEGSDTLKAVDRVRRRMIFNVQNVLTHSPFLGLDLVMCRNLLIYLQTTAQRRALANFHFGLRDSGLLVLGESEGTGKLEDQFEIVSAKLRVYAKRPGTRLRSQDREQLNRRFETMAGSKQAELLRKGSQLLTTAASDGAAPVRSRQRQHWILEAMGGLLGDGILVNAEREVLFVSGDAGRLLTRVPTGLVQGTLDEALESERLLSLIEVGIAQATQRNETVSYDLAEDDEDAGSTDVARLTIRPLPPTRQRMYFLTFAGKSAAPVPSSSAPATVVDARNFDRDAVNRILELESELTDLRALVRESIEEKEVVNEELQSSNEELLASNEELQSTNEELQSVNEELQSLNEQYQDKIDELTEANAYIGSLVENTDVALMLLDDHLQILRFTPPMQRYFSVTDHDLGRNIREFRPFLQWEDMDEALREVVQSRSAYERNIRTSEGRWLRVRIQPQESDKDGEIQLVVTAIDIDDLHSTLHKLRESVLRYELVEDGVGFGIWDWYRTDEDTIYFSPSFVRLLGREELGMPASFSHLMELVHPDDRRQLQARLQGALRGGERYSNENRFQCQSGDYRWFAMTAMPSLNEDGSTRLIGSLLDVDTRKRGEQLLQDEQMKLLRSERIASIGQVAAGVAHELNNPLQAVMHAVQIMQRRMAKGELAPADIDKGLGRLMDNTMRMKTIVSGLLSYSRGDESEEVRRLPVSRLIDDTAQIVGTLTADDDTELRIGQVPETWQLTCRPVQVSQVLVNLVKNAVDAVSSQRQRWVAVDVEKKKDRYVFTVSDAGRGIDGEVVKKMFTPFFSTKSVASGTGLGLAICQKIIELHGGHLEYRLTADGHTSFVFDLPMQTRA